MLFSNILNIPNILYIPKVVKDVIVYSGAHLKVKVKFNLERRQGTHHLSQPFREGSYVLTYYILRQP